MLKYLEREFKSSGEEGPEQIISGLHAILGKDIPFPISELTLSLEQATREYKNNPDDPKRLTCFHTAFWAQHGQTIGKICTVDAFPLESRKIQESLEKELGYIFWPAGVNLVDLRNMFPKMESRAVQKGNSIVNKVNNFGHWLQIETSIDAPNRNTTQFQLEEKFRKERKQGQSLGTYIIGGQISKLLTDKYFDEGLTWSRLLGSCNEGRVLSANFRSGGGLSVSSHWDPEDRDEGMGGRSEEVTRA